MALGRNPLAERTLLAERVERRFEPRRQAEGHKLWPVANVRPPRGIRGGGVPVKRLWGPSPDWESLGLGNSGGSLIALPRRRCNAGGEA